MYKCPKCGSEDVDFFFYKDYAVASCCDCDYEKRRFAKDPYEYFPDLEVDEDEAEE